MCLKIMPQLLITPFFFILTYMTLFFGVFYKEEKTKLVSELVFNEVSINDCIHEKNCSVFFNYNALTYFWQYGRKCYKTKIYAWSETIL